MCRVEFSLTSKIPTAQVIHLTWSLLIAAYSKDKICKLVGGATMHTPPLSNVDTQCSNRRPQCSISDQIFY